MNIDTIDKLSHQELLEAIKIVNSFLEYLDNAMNVGDNDE